MQMQCECFRKVKFFLEEQSVIDLRNKNISGKDAEMLE
jgi:hypothetical protein